MKTIFWQLFLSLLIFSNNAYTQYDVGTAIYSNTSSTVFTPVSKNYTIVDFDKDYHLDILTVMINDTSKNYQLTWFKGDGIGNFTLQTNIMDVENEYRENKIFYTDMNKDGIEDIVYQNSDFSFKVLCNDGQGNISKQIENEITLGGFIGADLKELADLDGDGDMDGVFFGKMYNIFWSAYVGYCIIGYNDGNGILSNYSFLGNDQLEIILDVQSADVDGDGNLDIICSGNRDHNTYGGMGVVAYKSPFVRLYRNLGPNGFTTQQEVDLPIFDETEAAFTHVNIQDINGDGSDELLIEHAIRDDCSDFIHQHGCSYLYKFYIVDYNIQNSDLIMLQTYNSWLHGYPLRHVFVDYGELYNDTFRIQFDHQNTDKNIDALSVNVPQGKLQWYLGDGNGNFNNTQVVNINNQYSSIKPNIRVIDIDYDTDLDIFVQLNDKYSSTLTVYKNLALSPICSHVSDLADTPLTDGVYQAGAAIISSGNVVIGNNVTLKAGKNIELQNGFVAPVNSTLNMAISACN